LLLLPELWENTVDGLWKRGNPGKPNSVEPGSQNLAAFYAPPPVGSQL